MYDLVIPLGEYCATAIALAETGIKERSYPFDWSAGVKWDICGKCGFLGKIKLICDDFKDAFRSEDFTEFWTAQSKHRSLLNKHTGLQYLHDFPWDMPVSEYFPEFKEKYDRRVKRLYENIEQANSVLFVFVTRNNARLSLDDINEGFRLLSEKFPNKNISILLLMSSNELPLDKFVPIDLSENIRVVFYKDNDSGLGNQQVIQRIFNLFIKRFILVTFATDNIAGFGLSDKEKNGRWSDGNTVILKLSHYMAGKNLKMEFDVSAFLNKLNNEIKVDVFVNSTPMTKWIFCDKNVISTSFLVHKDINSSDDIEIRFNIENAVSPQECGINNDVRKLGIFFRSLRITGE